MIEKKKPNISKNGEGEIIDEKNKIQVMVEIRKPRSLSLSAEGIKKLEINELEIDTSFTPIPMAPTSDQEGMVNVISEEIVCVCGRIDKDKIKQVESQPNVLKVWKDYKVQPFEYSPNLQFVQMSGEGMGTCPIPPCDCTPSVPKGTMTDVVNYLGVNAIWANGYKGDGIVVGICDGGITAEGRPINPADTNNSNWPNKLIKNVIGGPDTNWGTTGVVWGWHGNMTATDVLGMAPRAKIYDIRLTGDALSRALAGFQWAIDRHRIDGTPHILSNSWGMFQEAWAPEYVRNPNHPFTRKVVEAINEGILVLFAAGNCGGGPCADGRCGSDKGSGKSIWGANGHEKVMTVAAVNPKEEYIGYSSVGPAALHPKKPDFAAPSHFTGFFNSDSGTSASTPIVAGVVALLKQAKPSLTQQEAKDCLMKTAKDIGPSGWDIYTGAGIIQGKKTLDCIIPDVNNCIKYKSRALKYVQLYKLRKKKYYLCRSYYYMSLYYRCMVRSTNRVNFVCAYINYKMKYYRCMYSVTKNKTYQILYSRYRKLWFSKKCHTVVVET